MNLDGGGSASAEDPVPPTDPSAVVTDQTPAAAVQPQPIDPVAEDLPTSAEPPLVPDSHNAQVAEATTTTTIMSVDTSMTEAGSSEDGDEAVLMENAEEDVANKENQSSSPNVAHQLSSDLSAAAKRSGGKLLTAVNEKGRTVKASGSGNKGATMNSRGAMLLNLSR